jgi:hypothetical protein
MPSIRKELSEQFDAVSSPRSTLVASGEDSGRAGRWGPGAWKGRGGGWAPKADPVPSPSAKARRPSFQDTKTISSPLAPRALSRMAASSSPQEASDATAMKAAQPPLTRAASYSKDASAEPQMALDSMGLESAEAPSARRRSLGGAIAGLRALANAMVSPSTVLKRGRRNALVVHVLDEPRGVMRDFVFDRQILLNAMR